MQFLGIDIGTSAVKLCVTNEAGEVKGSHHAPLTIQHPFVAASEQDPDAWYAAPKLALQQMPLEIRSTIGAIGLSGQMHGAVLWMREAVQSVR